MKNVYREIPKNNIHENLLKNLRIFFFLKRFSKDFIKKNQKKSLKIYSETAFDELFF